MVYYIHQATHYPLQKEQNTIWKTIYQQKKNVEFETGKETSIAMVTHIVNVEFIVSAIDTNQNQIDFLSFYKELNSMLNRKVRFVKVDALTCPMGLGGKLML